METVGEVGMELSGSEQRDMYEKVIEMHCVLKELPCKRFFAWRVACWLFAFVIGALTMGRGKV